MKLDNILEYSEPFKHWELINCLDAGSLNEISYTNIPDGERSYDGTRAADHSGEGLDGKLRLFITRENSHFFPNLTKIINYLQSKDIVEKISHILKKDLSLMALFILVKDSK